MRGLTLERDKAIGVVIVLVLVFIFVIWALNVNKAQAQFSYRLILLMHCKEWQDTQCDPTTADSIMINIEGEGDVPFSVLCAREYDNRPGIPTKNKQWNPYGYEDCKTLCTGCPR